MRELPDELGRKCSEIKRSLRDCDRNDATGRYRVALAIREVRDGEANRYGENAMNRLASEVGLSVVSLYAYARVPDAWDEPAFKELQTDNAKASGSVCWWHLVELAKVTDIQQRSELLDAVRRERLSVRDLKDRIAEKTRPQTATDSANTERGPAVSSAVPVAKSKNTEPDDAEQSTAELPQQSRPVASEDSRDLDGEALDDVDDANDPSETPISVAKRATTPENGLQQVLRRVVTTGQACRGELEGQRSAMLAQLSGKKVLDAAVQAELASAEECLRGLAAVCEQYVAQIVAYKERANAPRSAAAQAPARPAMQKASPNRPRPAGSRA
jgi:hypothetical protein